MADLNASDIKEATASEKSKAKFGFEDMLAQNLFSPDVYAFLIHCSAVRVSFNYDPTLKPMAIQVTQAKMEQVEIKGKSKPKNPEEEPKDIIQYTRKPAYATHIIQGENIQLLKPGKADALNRNLEDTVPRESEDTPYNIKSSKLDSDRMVISLSPSVNKYSDSVQTFQDFIREKYELEMRRYAMNMQDSRALSSNSNPVARFALGTRRTAVGINHRM